MCIYIDSQNKALINSKSGKSVHPSCWDDLVQYHAYLLTSKHPEHAQQVLKNVFKGEKVISDMIKHNHKEK